MLLKDISMRILTTKIVNEKLAPKKIALKSDYIGMNIATEFQCLSCLKCWTSTLRSVLYQKGYCPHCHSITGLTTEQANQLLKNRSIQLVGEISNHLQDQHTFLCLQCNKTWCTSVKRVIKDKTRCPRCGPKALLDQFVIKERLDLKKLQIIGPYFGGNKKAEFRCLVCHENFFAYPTNLFKPERGCPACNTMKNEKLAYEYLQDILSPVNVKKNYRLNEKIIINSEVIKHYLIIDFYFELNNVKHFVEYNGIQHYKPTNFGHRMKESDVTENFRKQLIRDRWLKKYCRQNNVILTTIDGRKYTDEKIKEFLNKSFVG